jgi:hypothetical protein
VRQSSTELTTATSHALNDFSFHNFFDSCSFFSHNQLHFYHLVSFYIFSFSIPFFHNLDFLIRFSREIISIQTKNYNTFFFFYIPTTLFFFFHCSLYTISIFVFPFPILDFFSASSSLDFYMSNYHPFLHLSIDLHFYAFFSFITSFIIVKRS